MEAFKMRSSIMTFFVLAMILCAMYLFIAYPMESGGFPAWIDTDIMLALFLAFGLGSAVMVFFWK